MTSGDGVSEPHRVTLVVDVSESCTGKAVHDHETRRGRRKFLPAPLVAARDLVAGDQQRVAQSADSTHDEASSFAVGTARRSRVRRRAVLYSWAVCSTSSATDWTAFTPATL